MFPLKRYLTLTLLSAPVMLLQSCFTGVESTPKITAQDVRRQKVTVTPEMEFLADVKPRPFSEWRPGKELLVNDGRIDLIFKAGVAEDDRPQPGDTLRWLRAEGAVSVTGDSVTDLVFDRRGTELVYRVNASASALAARESVDVPFTIDLASVETARMKLKDRDLYILTPTWYDLDEKAVSGRRFVKVHVDDVVPGSYVYPVKVLFTADEEPQRCVLMSLVSPEGSRMRNFATLFAFDDPHKRYPTITDENWQLIQNSRVTDGMTRDECRLALGAPGDIDRRPATAGVLEVWNYDDGRYLIFQDGFLTGYRK